MPYGPMSQSIQFTHLPGDLSMTPRLLFGAGLALFCTIAAAQPAPGPTPAAAGSSTAAPAPTERLRGVVKSFDGATLVLAERRGETLTLAVAETFSVNEIVP